SRRRHTRSLRDWSSDVCSSDLSSRGLLRAPRCRKLPDVRFRRLFFLAATLLLFSCSKKQSAAVATQTPTPSVAAKTGWLTDYERSEERRVGKECRSRWSTQHKT